MKDWHVGQMVVCIKGDETIICQSLVKGRIYTLREIYNHWTGAGCTLEEVRNIENAKGEEFGYYLSRFRPLDESRLNQFRVHLNPKKVEEPA